ALSHAASVFHRLRRERRPPSDASLGDGPEAELFRDLFGSDPTAAENLARSTLSRPCVGDIFFGFQLSAVLGSGAFGQVFLARQRELANRHVALKLTACLCREAQTL